MTSYISAVNQIVKGQISQIPNLVVYGENINNGSSLSGLTRNLEVPDGSRILNVGNCEATQCGVGFGLMLNGLNAVLFSKQLDFMLLGMEQMVSTYTNIRAYRELDTLGSFTIVSVVCDQGFQGPQSSFNALGDMCSMARVPGYTITNAQDSALVLKSQLSAPGFRFVCLSQRLYGTDFLDLDVLYAADDCSVFQYDDGEDATIVCFNFSLPEGQLIQQKLMNRGVSSSLFSANYVFPHNWQRICESVSRTRKLVLVDDSKSISLWAHTMLQVLTEKCPPFKRVVVSREDDVDFGVSPDKLHVQYDEIMAQLGA